MRQLASMGTDHLIFRKLNLLCEGLSEYGDIMAILKHGMDIGAIRNDVPLTVLMRMNQEYEVWLVQELQEKRLMNNKWLTNSLRCLSNSLKQEGEKMGKLLKCKI